MKILKAIVNYFLNILTVLMLCLFALCVAIFAPKHLDNLIGIEEAPKKKVKKKK